MVSLRCHVAAVGSVWLVGSERWLDGVSSIVDLVRVVRSDMLIARIVQHVP